MHLPKHHLVVLLQLKSLPISLSIKKYWKYHVSGFFGYFWKLFFSAEVARWFWKEVIWKEFLNWNLVIRSPNFRSIHSSAQKGGRVLFWNIWWTCLNSKMPVILQQIKLKSLNWNIYLFIKSISWEICIFFIFCIVYFWSRRLTCHRKADFGVVWKCLGSNKKRGNLVTSRKREEKARSRSNKWTILLF